MVFPGVPCRLNMTSSSLATATLQQLRHLQNAIQDPLSGKKVMIPLTTKAFFAGQLEPEVDKDGNEQVIMKVSKEHFVTLQRQEVSAILEKRIEGLMLSETHASKEIPIMGNSQISTQATIDLPSSPTTLPFFEIREELDKEGNEVKAEAVNVVRELEYLQKKDVEMVDAITRKVGGDLMESVVTTSDNLIPNPDISDDDFDKISNRLSELALLEEEAETKKGVNEKSSKTLQGTGWSKGFLNSTSPNKKNIHIPISTKPAKITLEDDQSKPSSSIKKVGFSAQNKIHEIPRIGERSFASLKQPERMESSVPTGPRPFETEIFSGIIHERPVGERFAGERSRPKAEGKKNLSKFALERLGERG